MSAATFSRIVTVIALLGATLLPAGAGADGLDRRVCERCRRFWDDSPARMKLSLDFDKVRKEYYLCGPFCVMEELELHEGKEPAQLLVQDYPNRDDPQPLLMRADRAFFLYGVSGEDIEMAEPYVAAFRTEKDALAAKGALGGELMKWDKIAPKVKKLAAEYEPPAQKRPYRPTRPRGR
jgi:hypothetical protein